MRTIFLILIIVGDSRASSPPPFPNEQKHENFNARKRFMKIPTRKNSRKNYEIASVGFSERRAELR